MFAAFYNHKKPTGDSTCPLLVQRTKQVWELIKSEMDFSDREDPPLPPVFPPFDHMGSVNALSEGQTLFVDGKDAPTGNECKMGNDT